MLYNCFCLRAWLSLNRGCPGKDSLSTEYLHAKRWAGINEVKGTEKLTEAHLWESYVPIYLLHNFFSEMTVIFLENHLLSSKKKKKKTHIESHSPSPETTL